MDSTIYLNDRKYRYFDVGEGKCTFVLTYSKDIDSIYQCYSHQFLDLERMIVIDTSTCWNDEIDSMRETDRDELINDIRLLADIYWLEDYEIKIERELKLPKRSDTSY